MTASVLLQVASVHVPRSRVSPKIAITAYWIHNSWCQLTFYSSLSHFDLLGNSLICTPYQQEQSNLIVMSMGYDAPSSSSFPQFDSRRTSGSIASSYDVCIIFFQASQKQHGMHFLALCKPPTFSFSRFIAENLR